jgi:hypothetical protein
MFYGAKLKESALALAVESKRAPTAMAQKLIFQRIKPCSR